MATIFEDSFVCEDVDMVYKDPKNPSLGKVRDKRFDRVSRITAQSESYKVALTLDLHSQLYPVHSGERFILSLTSSIRLDGTPCDGTYDQSGEPTLMDRYDYVMCGRVFQQATVDAQTAMVCVSFGGLLMSLRGQRRALNWSEFPVDTRVYLLMKKI
ncbi:hypothetical protein CDCA_CDCA02G0671 [Cyanidium caldarium]|uniref:DNA-directed RNA polymerases I, II, and III subunit RPABC3 n=1 Tax=Cyanidium caldarium TaxID=2771 RepID=A0AAV9IRD7_CYACA|nr:hypothetical protein CDCA_CDCA02G0671 [Cyanidium caldarium]